MLEINLEFEARPFLDGINFLTRNLLQLRAEEETKEITNAEEAVRWCLDHGVKMFAGRTSVRLKDDRFQAIAKDVVTAVHMIIRFRAALERVM